MDSEEMICEVTAEGVKPIEENDTENLTRSVFDFSFGTFWNWFNPCCLDVWSSPGADETIVAYGARSFLLLADVHCPSVKKSLSSERKKEWKITYRDIINVFGYKAKQYQDPFRSINVYLTTVVFDRTYSLLKQSGEKCNTSGKKAMVFLGTSEGQAALYDCHQRITLQMDLSFENVIKKECCRSVTQRCIKAAAWLHFAQLGPVIFYSMDTHVVVWRVAKNHVSLLHDDGRRCGESRLGSGQLQISCLASLPAQLTSDRAQHRLAIGYNGGKIVIFGFDPLTGSQTSLTIMAENGHMDDICALSFAPYSLANNPAYHLGLLCSVSRDSVCKVWSCATGSELADYHILTTNSNSNMNSSGNLNMKGGSKSNREHRTNWFTAAFLPKCVVQHGAFEIVFTNASGDLLTISLPDKPINQRLRLSKASKSFQTGQWRSGAGEMMNHSFIVFNIAIDFDHLFALSVSLDTKMILWDLSNRSSVSVFNSFSNGALSIDACLCDKRISVVCGQSVFVLDFIDGPEGSFEVQNQRLPIVIPSAKSKFYTVLWNRNYFEKLGRLLVGTSTGDILHFDLNSKSVVFKNKGDGSNNSKIYCLVWMDALNNAPAVLLLYQSGTLMVHRLNQTALEPISNYIDGVPDSLLRKITAITTSSDEQRLLLLGNDDGSVDVFEKNAKGPKAYQHRFRFRPYNRPCLSLEYCTKTTWLAITALQENLIQCYLIGPEVSEPFEMSDKFVVKTVAKRKLAAHEDRVSATSWSPFNEPNGEKIFIGSVSYDTTCIVWDLASQTPLRRFFGHKSLVYSIRWCHFHPDYLFTGGEDNFFMWNWTQQPEYSSKVKINNRAAVKVRSLRKVLSQSGGDQVVSEDPSLEPIAEVENFKIPTIVTESALSSKSKSASSQIKALFAFSNQVENNSSKFETLEDIRSILMVQNRNEEQILEKNLNRVLIYTESVEHAMKFLEIEIELHQKNSSYDALALVSVFLDLKNYVEAILEKNEADAFVANLIANKRPMRDLWKKCCEVMAQGTKWSKTKWTSYPKECGALIRLHCQLDIEAAVEGLVSNGLYREALILARINLASQEFVQSIMNKWYEYRTTLANQEGAIKCLVASKRYSEALEQLEQRRTLSADCTTPATIKQFDEVINMLRDFVC